MKCCLWGKLYEFTLFLITATFYIKENPTKLVFQMCCITSCQRLRAVMWDGMRKILKCFWDLCPWVPFTSIFVCFWEKYHFLKIYINIYIYYLSPQILTFTNLCLAKFPSTFRTHFKCISKRSSKKIRINVPFNPLLWVELRWAVVGASYSVMSPNPNDFRRGGRNGTKTIWKM